MKSAIACPAISALLALQQRLCATRRHGRKRRDTLTRGRWRIVAILTWALCLCGAITPLPARAADAATIVEIKPGESFSSIAARFTGDPGKWRQLYDPRLSGLPNPEAVPIGTRLELVKRSDGTSYLRALPDGPAATQLAPAPATAAPAPSDTLVLGVLPNIPAHALLTQYTHMKRYLESAGQERVQIVTAASFKAFYASAARGEYDIAVMAVHLARLAQRDLGMLPVVVYEPPIRAVLVSPLERPVDNAQALRGQTVAFSNPESLVAMYALQWLARAGLQPGRDVTIRGQRIDLGVGRMVLAGEAAAAVLSSDEFRQIPAAESARLRITAEIARIPNFVVVAHPRLGAERIARLTAQLKALPSDRENGAAFLAAAGLTTISDPDEVRLREIDAFVERTRNAMSGAK